jgi:hypothetical protein
MAMFTNEEIKDFIADMQENTGEKLSQRAAKAMMEQQAEHDAEASDGAGEVYINGFNTRFPYNPELSYSENRKLALAARAAKDAEPVAELPELVPDVANPEGVPPVEATEPPAAPQAVTGPVLQVKQGLSLRGGRGEWYKLLCKYDGRPVAEYIAEGKASPASHYTARSTKCGQPKTPESRLSWFKRAGIVTIK